VGLIVHRCKKCQHVNSSSHDGKACEIAVSGLGRCCKVCSWGPSTLIPTFTPDGRQVEGITKPGQRWCNGLPATCSCEECTRLYEEIGKHSNG
jgi:hypothetical protein